MTRVTRKSLRNSRVLLGVAGSVAAYKSVELARRLKEEGASVRVLMTPSSMRFITPLSLEAASGEKVLTDIFDDPLSHVRLTEEADAFLVAPITANVIGKFANGIADCLLSTSLICFSGKVVIAPAMNTRMYQNPVLRRNLDYLAGLGVVEVPPKEGPLACGSRGVGKMADVESIVEAVKSAVSEKDLEGERLVITAGPTREYLDPIRFISNRSSGKMGYALAGAALRRGAEVTLISGPSHVKPPFGAKLIWAETAGEMRDAVVEELPSATAIIMAAAVADFAPAKRSRTKIEKASLSSIRLQRTPDILSELGSMKKRPLLVGFAAQTGGTVDKAKKKLSLKGADIIVFNDVSSPDSGFDVETNRVVIIEKNGMTEYPLKSKEEVADIILDRIKGSVGPLTF